MDPKIEWTPFERRLATALREEPATFTGDCLEPDEIITLCDRPDFYPDAARLLAHISGCAFCRHEYGEMRLALQAAERAHAASTAISPPDSAVVKRPSMSLLILWRNLVDRAAGPRFRPVLAVSAIAALVVLGGICSYEIRQGKAPAIPAVGLHAQSVAAAKSGPDRRPVGPGESIDVKNVRVPALVAGLVNLDSVRSATSNEGEVTLYLPVATAVASDRPVLRWSRTADVSGYEVVILDQSDHVLVRKVVPGSVGGPAVIQWRVTPALPRGQVCQWQVSAIGHKTTLSSPVARFLVLPKAQADAVARAAITSRDSHLALGVLFTKYGLLDDAVRELTAAGRDVATAQKLLHYLHDVRAGVAIKP